MSDSPRLARDPRHVPVTYAPNPVGIERRRVELPEGLTVAEIVGLTVPDPIARGHVHVFCRGRTVPRPWWTRVRPHAGALLELRVVPSGGGGKDPLRTILTIGVIAAAFAAPALLPASGTFAAGAGVLGTSLTVGQALTAAVAFGGLLAINTLVPNKPPQLGDLSGVGGSPTLFLEGARNRARPFSPIPVVLGRYRMTPPFGAQPVTEVIGGDQFLRLLFIWGVGPLQIDPDSIRIGETPLSSFEGVSVEHREGFPDDEPLTLYGSGGSTGSGAETIVEETLSVALPHENAQLPDDRGSFGRVIAVLSISTFLNSTSSNPIVSYGRPYGSLENLKVDTVAAFSNTSPTNPAPWVTRTTAANASAISVDVTFPQGLVYFGEVELEPNAVLLQVQFRRLGASQWTGVSWQKGEGILVDQNDAGVNLDTVFGEPIADENFVESSVATGGGHAPTANFGYQFSTSSGVQALLSGLHYVMKATSPKRFGIRWPVPVPGQYEVRLRCLRTAAANDDRSTDAVAWTALRTIREGDPVQTGVGGASAIPLARTALQIRATDQLNGIVDELSGVVTSYGPVWTGSAWLDDQPTTNPASLYRLVLQGPGNAVPLPDSRLDLDALADWFDFCEDHGFAFNQIRDFQSSVWETLTDVASAGRASPTIVDGKWSVVIDREQATPVSYVTPRNSFDFQSERVYIDPPHAWRIRFPNENQDYRQDERRVYADGFDATTATKFEALELLGVTDPTQVQRLGRFRIAQAAAQVERWTFKQALEFLTYQRGDRIAITHDVLQVGLASGRVLAVTADTNDDVVAIELDEEVEMAAGQSYGIAVRTVAGGQVTAGVVTEAGKTNELTLSDPIAATGGEATVRVGDVVGFGLLGEETDDAVVIGIFPENDLRARVVTVPYRPAIYDADTETVPTFDTNLTPLPSIPAPEVRSVRSGIDLVVLENGSLLPRIGLTFDPFDATSFGSGASVQVQARPTGTSQPYSGALDTYSEGSGNVTLSGVETGEVWDLRLRFVVPGRLPGPWTEVLAHQVVGLSAPPADLQGLDLTEVSGTARLTWTPPTEIDVRVGGVIRFRHFTGSGAATWAEGTPIGTADPNDGQVDLPLLTGTYLARVFDAIGTPSAGVTTVEATQTSVVPFTETLRIEEHPDFLGAKTGVEVVEPSSGEFVLQLSEVSWDEVPAVDAESSWDAATGVPESGTYEFDEVADLTTVQTVRVSRLLAAETVEAEFSTIDGRLANMDTWAAFDVVDGGAGTARVQVRHTPDDPAATDPDWSAWGALTSREITARGFEFRAILESDDPVANVQVSELGAVIESADFT